MGFSPFGGGGWGSAGWVRRRAGPGDLEVEARSTERLNRAGLGAAVVLEAEEAGAKLKKAARPLFNEGE